jgi:AcrR family transcriptional regulator
MNSNSASRRKPQPRLRERLREATHDAILNAAEGAFATEGVHEVRMETIAQSAGVAVGTLYNHFADRNALLGALLKARANQLILGIDQCLQNTAKQPFVEQLRAVVEVSQALLYSDGCVRVLMDGEGLHVAKASQPSTVFKQLRERFDALIQRGVAAGAIRGEDAAYYSWFILSSLRGLSVRKLKGDAPESPEAQRDALVRFLMRGMEKRP